MRSGTTGITTWGALVCSRRNVLRMAHNGHVFDLDQEEKPVITVNRGFPDWWGRRHKVVPPIYWCRQNRAVFPAFRSNVRPSRTIQERSSVAYFCESDKYRASQHRLGGIASIYRLRPWKDKQTHDLSIDVHNNNCAPDMIYRSKDVKQF